MAFNGGTTAPMGRLASAMVARGMPRLQRGAQKGLRTPRTPKPPATPQFHPRAVLGRLFAGTGPLSGPQTNQAARALTVLETRPQIHGYKQIATQLGQAKAQQDQGLANLGQRTQGNVSNTYRNIAESEAKSLATEKGLGEMLNQRSAAIGQQGAKELGEAQTGSTSQLDSQLAMRGAPGGGAMQQQLANSMASQRATQSADSQAAQQYAASQGANYAGLLAGEAGATQMRGGETVGQIGRDIVGRTAESDLKYNQNIQDALSKLGEAKASYGPDLVKNLLALRGGEQKFQLGREAVGVNRGKLAATQESNRIRQELGLSKLPIEQQKANAATQNAASSAKRAGAYNRKVNREGKGGMSRSEANKVAGYERSARSLIPAAVSNFGVPNDPAKQAEFVAGLAKVAKVPTYIAAQVVHNWLLNRQAKLHRGAVPGH